MTRYIVLLLVFAAALAAQPASLFQDFSPMFQFRIAQPGGSTYLGVNLAEVDDDRARELKLREAYGVEITRVEDGSPADKAGIKPNDVVLEYNGQRVEGMEQFGRMVRETPPGREVKLLISRNGSTQAIVATLGVRKLRPPVPPVPPTIEIPDIPVPEIPQIFTTLRTPRLGVEVEQLGPQLAAYFGVKQGVLVRSVLKDTPAEKAGVKAGDVITKVDGSSVNGPSELVNAVRSASSKKTFTVEVVREHKEMSISVTVDDGHSDRVIPGARSVTNRGR